MKHLTLCTICLIVCVTCLALTKAEANTCNRDAIIFSHYAKVADKIHGEAYRPELLPPRPKPITPKQN